MGDDIEINVTETTNIIEITPQPNDQIVDIAVTDNAPNVEINVTPSVIEINVTRGSSTALWGAIQGNLTDQTDLVTALGLKADLVGGKVPSTQLPSYVDDVIEVANYAALPTSGETGKIYVTLDNNKIYRWSGSLYIEIAANNAIWGAITGTLSNQTDLQNALNAKFDDPTGDTTQYIAGDGSLITFPVAGQSGTLVRQVRNTTGATLTKGTIVYINGANGNKPTVAKAIATGDSTSAQTFGMLQADLANNSNGYAVCVGDITGLDTSAITEGTQLYLSSTTAGAYTTTKQVAPAHLVYIGVVTRSHPTQGQIEVKIQNGYELDEIHDVLITSKANNDLLTYESSSSLWKNKSISTILGYTPSNDSNVVHKTGDETIAGVKKFNDSLTSDKAYNQKIISGGFMPDAGYGNIFQNERQITFAQFNAAATAVTQFSFIYPDSNTTQFYYLPNASGTLALTSQLHNAVTIGTANGLSLSTQVLSLGLASSSANGALSSTDWTTFNNKQNAITNLIDGIVTTGYIPKSTFSTSGLSTLGNSLIYDNGTNVGIGTTLPSSKLTVQDGEIKVRTANFVQSSTGTAISIGVDQSGQYGRILVGKTGDSVSSNLVLAEFGGNIGIGTTAPSEKLEVQNGALGAKIKVSNSVGGFASLECSSNASSVAQLTFTNQLSLIGGNVGIGTTSPTQKLDVSGNTNISGYLLVGSSTYLNSGNSLYFDSGVSNDYGIRKSGSSLIFTTGGNFSFLNGSVGIGTTAPSAKTHFIGGGVSTSIGNVATTLTSRFDIANPAISLGIGYVEADIPMLQSFNNTNNTSTNLTINPFGGNVGVGTTSPNFSATGRTVLDINGTSNTMLCLSVGGTAGSYFYQASGNLNISNEVSGSIINYTGGSERMRITSLGTVGINTTYSNAVYKLVTRTGVDSNIAFGIQNGEASIESFNDAVNAGRPLRIYGDNLQYYTNGSERMRITSGGQVQISSPISDALKLTNTNSGAYNGIIVQNDASNQVVLGMGGSTVGGTNQNRGYSGTVSNIDYYLMTNNSSRLLITSGGNVGIGTTSPSGKLHVSGGDSVFGSSNLTRILGASQIIDFTNSAQDTYVAGRINGLSLKFYTNSGSGIDINSSGNVGIGTTSPSYTLHVNGSVAGTSAYNNLSDKRYKKDILPIKNALDKILALNGVTFNWDKKATDMNLDDNNHIGLLAQDVEKIIPQAVTTGTDENQTKSVAYTDLVPVLIEAIKELTQRINKLENK